MMGALCNYLENWLKMGYNFDLGIVGKRGHGKSYASLKIASLMAAQLNVQFTIDNVHFKARPFLEQLNEYDKKNELQNRVFVLDEAGIGMDSQSWWDIEIKAVADEMETYRTYNCLVIFTAPMIANITKRAREMFSGYMKPDLPLVVDRKELYKPTTNILKDAKQSKWRFYLFDVEPDGMRGKNIVWRYKLRNKEGELRIIKVGLPPLKLRNQYEKRKKAYLRSKRENKIKQLKADETQEEYMTIEGIVRKVKRNLKKYTKVWQGRRIIRTGLIRKDFEVGKHRIRDVKDVIEYDLNEGKNETTR
jgi:hypothetical protein